jgi:type II secretory pathway pseudopilin PulG
MQTSAQFDPRTNAAGKPAETGRASGNAESGFVLLAVLFLVALILLSLAIAAPKVAKDIQRDRELELVHRGEQYKRAIKLYYRKFGAYPSSVDQLVNTNQIRFLRKRYTDPMTGKDDWKLIHFGQAHVKPLGLFGQPIANAGNTGAAGSSTPGGIGPGGIGSGGLAGNGLTGSPVAGGSDGSTSSGADGSSSSGTDGSGASGSTGSGTSPGIGTPGTPGTPGAPGSGLGSGLGSGTGSNSNPTFGGGPIVGVAIPSTKASIKEYKQQKHYNEWEFVYDPLEEQLGGTLFGGAQQNLNGPGSPTSPGGSTPMSGTGTGGSGPSTPTPTQ